MCGIAGFTGSNSYSSQLEILQKKLFHRGPDVQGVYHDKQTGLVHNRLSIIDLSDLANQPFRFRQWVMVYNGEIYNFAELRKKLESKGYDFTTNSDTEVLIKGFDCYGVEVVHCLTGMFVFAVYNCETEELYIFRDRLGVKPLYYVRQQGALLFASELKALEPLLKSREISTAGLIDYLSFGYTIGQNSIYADVYKLPPGHYLHYKNNKLALHAYWRPEDYAGDPIADDAEENLADQLEELLISSFRYRMISDVPVGIFFSGGVDSTALVALLSKHFGQINTFTIGFDDPAFDETPYARTIAGYFNTRHTEKILTIHEAQNRFDQFYKIYDEPFYDSSGIPTSLVSELAASHGMKVVLSSEGGDELFGGYPSYQQYYKNGRLILGMPHALRKWAGGFLHLVNNTLSIPAAGNKLLKLSNLLEQKDWLAYYLTSITTFDRRRTDRYITGIKPQENHPIIHGLAISKNLHPIELFMLWDIKYLIPDDFLVKVDRATMHHSIENREPFLDHKLVQFCLRLPLHYKIRNGQTKYLLRKVLARYIPPAYLERPKMGFSIPLFNWFKKDLDKLFNIYLERSSFTRAWPQINYDWVKQQLAIYNHSKKIHRELNMVVLWKLLGLMMWHESRFRQ
jgi:asparagine synthase (glutamine-hydrolysing)